MEKQKFPRSLIKVFQTLYQLTLGQLFSTLISPFLTLDITSVYTLLCLCFSLSYPDVCETLETSLFKCSLLF